MADETWSTAARFRYIDPQGATHLVVGEAGSPACTRNLIWQGFRVQVRPEAGAKAVSNWFMFDIEFVEDMAGQPDPSDRDVQLKWLRVLRRYALQHILEGLDAGTLQERDHTIQSTDWKALSACLPRSCDFIAPDVSGTLCQVNAGDDAGTTQAICDACAVPDLWERCARVVNIRTYPIRTDQQGVIRRECTAQCDVGKQPSDAGGIPHRCRFGDRTPPCFEPGLLRGPPDIKRGHMGLRAPDQQ